MKNEKTNIYDTTIRLFLLLLVIVWCLMIIYPFVSIMLWSLIFAIGLFPLHNTLTKKLGEKPKLASFIIITSILLIIVLPSFLMVNSIIDEVKELKVSYNNGTLTIPAPTEKVKNWPLVGEKLYVAWMNASDNLGLAIQKNEAKLTGVVSKLVKEILSAFGGIFQIIIAFIIAGVLLNVGGAGESMRKLFRKIAGQRGDEFADIVKLTVGNVVKGVLGVAVIQATLVGLGFMLAGVPYAGLLTLVVFIFAVLQLPPTLLVIPVIVYLFSGDSIVSAILWSVYLFLAGFSDNVLKPILLGKGAPVPMLIIFIGVVGGFMFSGFVGLFTGAIVMSIGYKLFSGWLNSENRVEQA